VNSAVPLVPAAFTYNIDRPMQHVVHDLVKARAYIDSRVGMWSMVYAYQNNFRQEYDVLRKDNGKAQLNLTLATQTLNLNLDHKPIAGFKGQVGIDGIYQENFYQPGDRLFIPNYSAPGIAAYMIERYKLHDWQLEAGVRYDYKGYDVYNVEGTNQQTVHYTFAYNNMSGTLGLSRKMSRTWDLSATLANAWRAPQATELFSAGLHHGAARIELGDKSLKPERSYNLNVESKHSWNKLDASISLYSQYIQDFIYLSPGADVLTIRGFFKSFAYTQTNAWLNGADVSLHYSWNKHLSTHFKSSLLRALDVVNKDWLILMPADQFTLNARYAFDVNKRFKECYVSVEGKQVLQQTRIPSNFDSVDFPRPPAAYFLVNAEAGTTINIKKQALYLSISATNILNQKYRDYLDVFRYFIDRPGRNIALRLRVPFTF
jgi:iron complex outermembrane receptor protein